MQGTKLREPTALSSISSPFVCSYVDAKMEGEDMFIVLEYIDAHPLSVTISTLAKYRNSVDLSHQMLGFVDEYYIWYFLADCLLGLYSIHASNFLHRDIKPSNIMNIQSIDGRHLPCICDLGLCRKRTDVVLSYNIGSPGYASPEMIDPKKEGYDIRLDVFSLGVTILEFMILRNPVKAYQDPTLHGDSVEPFIELFPDDLIMRDVAKQQDVEVYSDELLQIVAWMMSKNQSHRPSVEQLLRTPPIIDYAKKTIEWYLEQTSLMDDELTLKRRQSMVEIQNLLNEAEICGEIEINRVFRWEDKILLQLDPNVAPPSIDPGNVYGYS
ncbi:putative Serine/Threonine kinase domain protein [Blattamonas nauphoetae]|uniref:non-specific serine/threonine protein kinase n=1 Tax=Blattamonas nauphoetae TaxID=2049346 RepID=A0ABQ9X770_9EUKA|nr:putative Serine/Threonine kinase domain protein [Blattamonas nauphoetae]